MKKYIFITLGVGLGITSIVASSVLATAASNEFSPGLTIINNSLSLYNGNKTQVGIKEAVIGTNKINNGNYVLYFGSQGIESNAQFLYDIPAVDQSTSDTAWNNFVDSELISNKQVKLGGKYFPSINYVLNTKEQPWASVKDKPLFISYIHTLNAYSITRKQAFAKKLEGYLNEVVKIAPEFDKLSDDKKASYNQKYSFVRSNATESGVNKFPNAISDFNTPENQKIKWVIETKNLSTWSYSPFATYNDLDSSKHYFNDDLESQEFRDLWSYIKTRFPNAKDLADNISPGFILGYKNGKLTTNYPLSFNVDSSNQNGDTPPPSTTAPTRSLKITNQANNTNNNEIVTKPSNDFYQWLSDNYAK